MPIIQSYDNISNLSSGHLNRLRRRNKNNYNRIMRDITKTNVSKNIDKLNNQLKIYLSNLSLIDNIINNKNNNNNNNDNHDHDETIIVTYNNGQIVQFGTMDYLILTNR